MANDEWKKFHSQFKFKDVHLPLISKDTKDRQSSRTTPLWGMIIPGAMAPWPAHFGAWRPVYNAVQFII